MGGLGKLQIPRILSCGYFRFTLTTPKSLRFIAKPMAGVFEVSFVRRDTVSFSFNIDWHDSDATLLIFG